MGFLAGLGTHLGTCRGGMAWQSGGYFETHTGEIVAMLPAHYRIHRVQRTLRWFENDVALLNLRVKDLSAERQQSARQFAAALITRTREELERLLQEEPLAGIESEEIPCEPAD